MNDEDSLHEVLSGLPDRVRSLFPLVDTKYHHKLGVALEGLVFNNRSLLCQSLTELALLLYDTGGCDQVFKCAQEISAVRTKLKSKPIEQLENGVRSLLAPKFPLCTITFNEKRDGVQLGRRVEVTRPDGTAWTTFFAKTHHKGFGSQKSNSPLPVDLIELYIYKLLARIQVGPPVHFIFNSPTEVSIVTEDAAGQQDNVQFLTFAQLRNRAPFNAIIKRLDDQYLAIVSEQPKNGRNTATNNFNNNDNNSATQPALSIIHNLTKADLISRILVISDVLNNSTNFGFNTNNSSVLDLRIVDFIPPINDRFEQENIFLYWSSGNTTYNYFDHAALFTLKARPAAARLETARHVMSELASFPRAAQETVQDIQPFAERMADPGKEKAGLSAFCEAAISNFMHLCSGINSQSSSTLTGLIATATPYSKN